MNNTKTFRKFNSASLLVALFIFLRAFVLSDRKLMGFTDFYPLKLDFSVIGIITICLYLAFAVLSALLFSKLEGKFGKAGVVISALFITEPLLFVKQENCINLFIWCLALLFILNALRDKPVIPNEITLIVFLFASTVLFENALFLYVFPALVFYFSADIDKLFKSTKNIIMMCISAISVCAGIVLNDYLLKTYPAFDAFIKEYTFFKQVYFKHIEYENVLLFVFAVPALVFGVYFFKEMFKNKVSVLAKTKSNKKNKEIVESFNPAVAVGAVIIAYIFSIAGFIQAGSSAFYTINYIVPLSVIAFLNAGNSSAEKSMQKINVIIEKHSLVFIAVSVALFYFAARVFLSETDSLAIFVMTMN